MTIRAWHHWYHLMASTYGTWLPGDPRGFRTRGHREHIDGDYRHRPPAGRHDDRWRRSKRLMKRDPVLLCPTARPEAVAHVRHALVEAHAIEVLAIAINDVHLHLLARLPGSLARAQVAGRRSAIDDPPRHYLGIAKQWSAKRLAEQGLVQPGGVWARRGKVKPIADRRHQVRVFNYILEHIDEGAAVWSFRDDAIRMK